MLVAERPGESLRRVEVVSSACPIAERVEQISRDVLRIEFGSLYPALHRMEESGWVTSSWAASDTNRRARFYALTAKGRKRLAEEEEHWTRLTGAVGRVLREA